MNLSSIVLGVLQGVLTVGPSGQYQTISSAIAAAHPYDTVRVAAGVYEEHLSIDQPITLLGQEGAVIDGGGQGIVITINATSVVDGFTIRGSGTSQPMEHSGILAENADGLVVTRNRFEDVLFGVYVKTSHGVSIRDNYIEGKDLPVPRRGDAIRLWSSNGGRVNSNVVRRARDVVIWFSDSAIVRDNYVTESRYGLHYMYSDDNYFEGNEFVDNDVGAFLMYSKNLTFRNNVFASARGITGRGLAFKDTDNISASDNILIGNATGLLVDNSPTNEGVTNLFERNVVMFNDVGVALLPSVHSNVFRNNDFLENMNPVAVSGGGTAAGNGWEGNYWSDYVGFDANGDGIGDTPYVHERLSNDLFAKHKDLSIFSMSLATSALDLVSRVIPLLQPTPVVVDSHPILSQGDFRQTESAKIDLAGAGVLFFASVLSAGVAFKFRRPFRRAA